MSTITELATQMQRVADETAELAEGFDTEDYAETRKDYERSAELLQNGARCITDLLHDLDQIKCEHRAAVKIAATQEREINETLRNSREINETLRNGRDNACKRADFEKTRADTNAATLFTAREQRAERTRERDKARGTIKELQSKLRTCGNSHRTVCRERDNARTLLEQAEYDRDRTLAIAARITDQRDAKTRHIERIKEQCEFALAGYGAGK